MSRWRRAEVEGIENEWAEGDKIRLALLACAKAWGVLPARLLNGERLQPVAEARNAAYLLSQELTGWSTVAIGIALERDHSTVLNGISRARALSETSKVFSRQIAEARIALGLGEDVGRCPMCGAVRGDDGIT